MGVLPLSVRIVTNPRNSPFRIDSRVEFTCEVDPAPTQQLIYKWRAVENYYGSSTYTQQSFNRTFSEYTLRYCWYFCSVLQNQTVLGSANKLVEVHGKVIDEYRGETHREWERGELKAAFCLLSLHSIECHTLE